MEKDEIKNKELQTEDIEQIMRERQRLDSLIHDKFKKRRAILFSDVCGFTKYMETKGDISGRAWLQKHHDIVLPLIKGHGGDVLKIMGDGVMSSFGETLAAVKAAVSIQKGLQEYNKKADKADELHVSMGINTGEILLDGGDIIGDVVNTASRIESHADRDQILLSRAAYEDVRGSEDILCRLHGKVQVKGKSEPLELYRVVWQDEEVVISEAPLLRSGGAQDKIKYKKQFKVLNLDLSAEKDRLKISVSEQSSGELSTVIHYEDAPLSMGRIEERCHEIIEILNNANRSGRLTREVLMRLRELGRIFLDDLFTLKVKEKMESSAADHLILHLDDQLVQVPWELLYDGRQFLCQRFNMGRLVRTRQTVLAARPRILERPLKMLVMADPNGDLKEASEEGRQIRDFMDRNKDLISVSLFSNAITSDFIKEKIRNFDLVHFAGHADYDPDNPGHGGWRLSQEVITAQDISRMAGTSAMPALIFSNACQSARTEEWALKEYFQDEIFGLANAFILTGVKHYIGTFWEVLDEPSRLFALEFYKQVISGRTIGEAMRLARQELIDKFGEETIVWASYLLYGDPTFSYMEQIREKEAEPEKTLTGLTRAVDAGGASKEEMVATPKEKPKNISGLRWGAGIAAVILACLLWVYPGFLRSGTDKYEQSAMAYYQAGDYSNARDTSQLLLKKSPKKALGYLILGNILFREGDLEKARSLFIQATEAGKATAAQKSEALLGLGRIASVQKDTKSALTYYQQAAETDPGTSQAYASRAVLLGQQGDYDQALSLFKKAEEISPDDYSIKTMANDTLKKASDLRDQEKQARIDKLVQELLSSAEKALPAAQSDGWTSLPLTLWMMDFETRGYSLEEGKEQVIASGVMEKIIEKSRAQVVERAVLDKIMEELKLSSTKLVDRNTALSIGRIMAARLILSGQAIHSGPETQISIRIIDTETGEIKGAINEIFGSAVPPSTMADKLSGGILDKLNTLYPLRGKVAGINGDQIELNIGQREGVKEGQQFRLKEGDAELTLVITGVRTDTSTAKQGQGAQGQGLEKGMRVEAL
jgi:class 3 adenylate cyclase/CHAT domain-containing protein/tetratricopeptide (TPR) repeat protein